MKQKQLLSQFTYSIPAKTFASSRRGSCSKYSPSMVVQIDFNNGKFFLYGDWQFIMRSNCQAESSWISAHGDSVNIELDIQPDRIIDLSNSINNGLTLFMKGTLSDGKQISPCTGMLAFSIPSNHAQITDRYWELSFDLYSHNNEGGAIKFKLPVYLNMPFSWSN